MSNWKNDQFILKLSAMSTQFFFLKNQTPQNPQCPQVEKEFWSLYLSLWFLKPHSPWSAEAGAVYRSAHQMASRHAHFSEAQRGYRASRRKKFAPVSYTSLMHMTKFVSFLR